jgi:hypothetical protein
MVNIPKTRSHRDHIFIENKWKKMTDPLGIAPTKHNISQGRFIVVRLITTQVIIHSNEPQGGIYF